MVVHVEIDKDADPVICPYPPTPQNSLFFYINDRIRMQREGEEEGKEKEKEKEKDVSAGVLGEEEEKEGLGKAAFKLQPRNVIVGPQLKGVRLDINKSHKAVRVGFHPGGLYRLLGFSLSEMIDDSYDAVDIFGNEMKELEARLPEAGNFDEIRDLTEDFLLQQVKKLKPLLPFDLAMLELMKVTGNISIENIASMACLSLRQFERVSKQRMGISPKLFARLVRFSKAYRLRESSPQLNWTQIAHECGYFDQMHFIRDFREFSGVTPGIMDKEFGNIEVRLQADLRL